MAELPGDETLGDLEPDEDLEEEEQRAGEPQGERNVAPPFGEQR